MNTEEDTAYRYFSDLTALLDEVLAACGSARPRRPPGAGGHPPRYRFGLIAEALSPLSDTLGTTDPAGFTQLKNDLAAVVSAEALFVLTDLAGLTPDDAIASLVRTATALTVAALEQPWPGAV